MTTLQDVHDAIKRNLPAEVGGVLQTRLAAADALEKDNAALIAENKRLKGLELEHRQLEEQRRAQEAREKQADARAASLDLREAVLKANETHVATRIDEMRGVVRDVFGNNRFKYRETGNAPAGVGASYQGGPDAAIAGLTDRTVEGER